MKKEKYEETYTGFVIFFTITISIVKYKQIWARKQKATIMKAHNKENVSALSAWCQC